MRRSRTDPFTHAGRLQGLTFVVQNVLRERQHGGENAADAHPQHTCADEEEHPAGVEDHQQELHQYGPHLRQTDGIQPGTGEDRWGIYGGQPTNQL